MDPKVELKEDERYFMHKKYFLFSMVSILTQLNFSSDQRSAFETSLSGSSVNFNDMFAIAEAAAALIVRHEHQAARKTDEIFSDNSPISRQEEKTGRLAPVVTIVIPSIEILQSVHRKSPERLDKNSTRQTIERATSPRLRTLQAPIPHFMMPTLSSRARTKQNLNKISGSLFIARGDRLFFPIVQTRGSVGGVRAALGGI
jgi:hypothetical protein